MSGKRTDPGINWGIFPMKNGKLPNVDDETGIRYGVISSHDVDAWMDESEPIYPCEECDHEQGDDECSNEMCEMCEPCGFQMGDEHSDFQAIDCLDSDVMVLKSPYFTYAAFCSPCVPGACNLNDPLDKPLENNRAYCFGPDAFYHEPCPYPVYLVKTGECIYMPGQEELPGV